MYVDSFIYLFKGEFYVGPRLLKGLEVLEWAVRNGNEMAPYRLAGDKRLPEDELRKMLSDDGEWVELANGRIVKQGRIDAGEKATLTYSPESI